MGPMSTKNDTEKKKPGIIRVFVKWSFWIAILISLYVLSAGPVGRLKTIGRQVYGMIYAPVITAGHHCPPFQDFLGWYIYSLWHVDRSRGR